MCSSDLVVIDTWATAGSANTIGAAAPSSKQRAAVTVVIVRRMWGLRCDLIETAGAFACRRCWSGLLGFLIAARGFLLHSGGRFLSLALLLLHLGIALLLTCLTESLGGIGLGLRQRGILLRPEGKVDLELRNAVGIDPRRIERRHRVQFERELGSGEDLAIQRDHVAVVADADGAFIGLITKIDLLNYLRQQT